jgi:hypothetical protein
MTALAFRRVVKTVLRRGYWTGKRTVFGLDLVHLRFKLRVEIRKAAIAVR